MKPQIFSILTLLFALVLPCHSEVIIEQNVVTNEADYGSGFGQSFLLPSGATLSAIQIHIGSVGNGGGSAVLRLWEADGQLGSYFTRQGSSPVATGTLNRSDLAPPQGWTTIILDKEYVNLSPAPVYLVFEIELLTSGSDGWNNYSYSNLNSFDEGYSVYWTGNQYAIRDGQDLTFRLLNSINIVSQLDYSGGYYHFSSQGFGQSFKSETNSQLTGGQLYIKASPFGVEDATIEIFEYNDEAKMIVGESLAQGVIHKERVKETGSWVDFWLKSPANIVKGNSYAFIVKENRDSSNQYGISSDDVYSNGNWLDIQNNGSMSERDQDIAFQLISTPPPHLKMSIPVVRVDRIEGNPNVQARVEILLLGVDAAYEYTLFTSNDLSHPIEQWSDLGKSTPKEGMVNWWFSYQSLPKSQFFVVKSTLK